MKASLRILLILMISIKLSFAQESFSYKRQLSYKQCTKCGCKKTRSYQLKSNNLTNTQIKCAENDMNAEIKVKELLQGGTSGGLFAAYNAPQEGCRNDCYHEFSNASDKIETIQISDCSTNKTKNQIDKSKTQESNNENVIQKTDLFSGEGTLTYTNGDKYIGSIVEGKPDGEGKIYSEYYIGYVSCFMKKGDVQRWEYVREDNEYKITTKMSYGSNFTCKINDESVMHGNISNYKIAEGDLFFRSGNKLWFKIKQNTSFDYEVSKFLSNGIKIQGEITNPEFLYRLNSFSIGPVQIPAVVSKYPEEVYINGPGNLHLKDKTVISGNFKNDTIIGNKGKITFPNDDYYIGEFKFYEGSIYMHGEGILYTKGKSKPQTGYWKYNQFVSRKKKDK